MKSGRVRAVKHQKHTHGKTMKTTKRKSASAGRKDSSIRSDCYVELTIAGVVAYRSISPARSMRCTESQSEHSSKKFSQRWMSTMPTSSIEDRAVPFVIAARVEAAVKRALGECNQSFLSTHKSKAERVVEKSTCGAHDSTFPETIPGFS